MKIRNGFVSNSSSTAFLVPLEVFNTPESYKQIIELADEFKDEEVLKIVDKSIVVPFRGDADYFKEKICKILCISIESYWANQIKLTNSDGYGN